MYVDSPPDVSHLSWDRLLTGFTGHHCEAPQSVQETSHGDETERAAFLWELRELGPPDHTDEQWSDDSVKSNAT